MMDLKVSYEQDVFEQVGGNRNKGNCTDFKCTLQLD